MSAWPPPPDLASIQELVRTADTEGFIAIGAPADEYDSEAEDLFASIEQWPTDQITAANLTPVIERIWRKGFAYNSESSAKAYPALLGLAQQIARFFGPEATPQVRDGSR